MTQREHIQSQESENSKDNNISEFEEDDQEEDNEIQQNNEDLQLERKDTTQTVPAIMVRNFKENMAENQMNIDMISEIYASEIQDLIDVDDTSIMRKLEQIEIFDNDDILAAQ